MAHLLRLPAEALRPRRPAEALRPRRRAGGPPLLLLAVRAEWCKVRDAPATPQAVVLATALPVLAAAGLGRATGGSTALGDDLTARAAAAFGWHHLALVVLLVVAATAVTQEHLHRTSALTMLALPRAWAVLGGKWLVHGAAATGVTALVLPLSVVAVQVSAGGSLAAAPGALRSAAPLLLLGPVVALLLVGVAVGLAALLRWTPLVAVAVPLWCWLGEPVAGGELGPAGRVLPLTNAYHVLGVGDLADPGWSPAVSLAVLAATALVAFGLGCAVLARRPGR